MALYLRRKTQGLPNPREQPLLSDQIHLTCDQGEVTEFAAGHLEWKDAEKHFRSGAIMVGRAVTKRVALKVLATAAITIVTITMAVGEKQVHI